MYDICTPELELELELELEIESSALYPLIKLLRRSLPVSIALYTIKPIVV